ncbi:MAG: succinylglutamate desuccinylase/aspartoacylase family protein [Sutterella sp.]|nr:succinylglutamate desuccinylase/aspartoacylase family protein [Sutterella sp.]
MKKVRIYEMPSLYREPLEITGYRFGQGEKAMAVVGAVRGNEIQQLYICSQLVKKLKEIEAAGGIRENAAIEVIPCVNPYSVNIGKRFWAMDNTDINRMFPGYDQGETTQRIAAGVFEHLQGWKWGVHFASFYRRGDFVPHVRLMKTDFADPDAAVDFGLPFVLTRKPLPIDTTTLNYNWQIWDTKAYTILTRESERIDPVSARTAVNAVLRFLARQKIITYRIDGGRVPEMLRDSRLVPVHATAAGIFRPVLGTGDQAHKGEVLAEIIDPGEGKVLKTLESPADGLVFFACRDPLILQRQIVFEIIRDFHGG